MCTPTKWTYKVQAYNDQTGCEVIMLVLNKENIFDRNLLERNTENNGRGVSRTF